MIGLSHNPQIGEPRLQLDYDDLQIGDPEWLRRYVQQQHQIVKMQQEINWLKNRTLPARWYRLKSRILAFFKRA